MKVSFASANMSPMIYFLCNYTIMLKTTLCIHLQVRQLCLCGVSSEFLPNRHPKTVLYICFSCGNEKKACQEEPLYRINFEGTKGNSLPIRLTILYIEQHFVYIKHTPRFESLA